MSTSNTPVSRRVAAARELIKFIKGYLGTGAVFRVKIGVNQTGRYSPIFVEGEPLVKGPVVYVSVWKTDDGKFDQTAHQTLIEVYDHTRVTFFKKMDQFFFETLGEWRAIDYLKQDCVCPHYQSIHLSDCKYWNDKYHGLPPGKSYAPWEIEAARMKRLNEKRGFDD